MPMEEIWEIKEAVSKKIFGKTTDEINAIIKPGADRIMNAIKKKRKARQIV